MLPQLKGIITQKSLSVLFVCCLIVVPLPPGENPFAVNDNNNNKNNIIPSQLM
jgi:hypothetical protein